MTEAQLPRVLDGDRPAKARAAVQTEVRTPREVQVQDVEERLVPAHGDAVLRDATEPGEHAFVERGAELRVVIFDGARAVHQLRIERLDLQPVDADDAESLIEEVVREGVASGTHPHDQHVDATIGTRVRALDAQRVPARQQAPDLESPR